MCWQQACGLSRLDYLRELGGSASASDFCVEFPNHTRSTAPPNCSNRSQRPSLADRSKSRHPGSTKVWPRPNFLKLRPSPDPRRSLDPSAARTFAATGRVACRRRRRWRRPCARCAKVIGLSPCKGHLSCRETWIVSAVFRQRA